MSFLISRRDFLKAGGVALAGAAAGPSFLFGRTEKDHPIFIAIFQRGAADGISMVVPFGVKNYYAVRPQIAIPEPSRSGDERAIVLDGFFAVHPSLGSFKSIYDERHLAIVHAVGSPSNTRSHFDAQDYMESGTPDDKGTRDGWLNRYLATKGTCEECDSGQRTADSGQRRDSSFRAVAMTQQTPRILMGPAAAVAMNSIDEFAIRANGPAAANIEAMYAAGGTDVVHAAGSEMIEAMKMLRAANPTQY